MDEISPSFPQRIRTSLQEISLAGLTVPAVLIEAWRCHSPVPTDREHGGRTSKRSLEFDKGGEDLPERRAQLPSGLDLQQRDQEAPL